MTFEKAYKYAIEHSNIFRKHDAEVKKAMEVGEATACLIFSVEAGETFYYGFDGVDLHKGKHARRRAETLFNRHECLIIL